LAEQSSGLVACVDFGSTFTKAALVDADSGELLATAEHPITMPGSAPRSRSGDVLDGWFACLDRLAETDPRARSAEVLACSSAGGGLRIGVVGNEQLVTAEAGRRVALSSGGRVVHLASAPVDRAAVRALRSSRPDVVLLVGGTDGGNADALLAAAGSLAGARWRGPVVVAGNIDARADVAALLDRSGTPYVPADNVVPRIGVLAPASARAAIREMFVRHVIGGKHLSRSRDFTEMVTGATPDVVLTAVELLARGIDDGCPGVGDVVVVDVGGATTDVHSVVAARDVDESGLSREVVATGEVTRTVEGDLGVRWSAVSTAAAGAAAELFADPNAVSQGARRRQDEPLLLPDTDVERRIDQELAGAAAELALRRHAGRSQVAYSEDGRVVERSGKDLREVELVVGSGGVLRHLRPLDLGRFARLGRGGLGGGGEGWQLPRSARVVVDRDYVLAPAGLLARDHPRAAYALLQQLH
jgi:uncharacterized protein (TIGR01319 family)